MTRNLSVNESQSSLLENGTRFAWNFRLVNYHIWLGQMSQSCSLQADCFVVKTHWLAFSSLVVAKLAGRALCIGYGHGISLHLRDSKQGQGRRL